MGKVLSFQQIFGDAVVIDQPASSFPERRITHQRVILVAGIKGQIVLLSGGNTHHFDARFTL